MIKFYWKTEYSVAVIIIFAIILSMVPMSFYSKEANFISDWNNAYNKIYYMFTAMSAQAESDIVKNLKNADANEEKEKQMIKLVKPNLRLSYDKKKLKKYQVHYMNGNLVKKKDFYYFKNIYISENNKIVGIKDIKGKEKSSPEFMIMLDMNGDKGPNIWGRDIFGLDIYIDGEIKALGHDWSIEKMKKDCSKEGSGISCSYFYRIGGRFNE